MAMIPGLVATRPGAFALRYLSRDWTPTWQKAFTEGRDYLSIKLDPSFPAPICATPIEVEGEVGLPLIWPRPNRD